MGSLRYESLDPKLLQQVVTLLEDKKEDYSVKYFSKQLHENKLLDEDLLHLLDRVRYGNEPVHLPED